MTTKPASLESHLTAAERETVITTSDADDYVECYTCQRRHITRLDHDPRWERVDGGTYGGSVWARFRIPADQWNPATGAKRRARPLTDDERAAAGERLARLRRARAATA